MFDDEMLNRIFEERYEDIEEEIEYIKAQMKV